MKKIVVAFAGLLITSGAIAEPKPFNASITPDIAVHDRTDTIRGVTLSIWGENEQTSLAIGLVNIIPENEWFSDLPKELAPAMIFVNWRF